MHPRIVALTILLCLILGIAGDTDTTTAAAVTSTPTDTSTSPTTNTTASATTTDTTTAAATTASDTTTESATTASVAPATTTGVTASTGETSTAATTTGTTSAANTLTTGTTLMTTSSGAITTVPTTTARSTTTPTTTVPTTPTTPTTQPPTTTTTTTPATTTTILPTTTGTLSILSISPSQGAIGIPAVISLVGANFPAAASSVTVYLDGVACGSSTVLSDRATVVCNATTQTSGAGLVVSILTGGVAANFSNGFTFYAKSDPISVTIAGDVATFNTPENRANFRSQIAKLLALETVDQVLISGVQAGSVLVNFYLLASAAQADAITSKTQALKTAAASGALSSSISATALSVAGTAVSVAIPTVVAATPAITDDSKKLKDWEIALIVIGSFFGVVLIGVGIFFAVRASRPTALTVNQTEEIYKQAVAQHTNDYKTTEAVQV